LLDRTYQISIITSTSDGATDRCLNSSSLPDFPRVMMCVSNRICNRWSSYTV